MIDMTIIFVWFSILGSIIISFVWVVIKDEESPQKILQFLCVIIFMIVMSACIASWINDAFISAIVAFYTCGVVVGFFGSIILSTAGGFIGFAVAILSAPIDAAIISKYGWQSHIIMQQIAMMIVICLSGYFIRSCTRLK